MGTRAAMKNAIMLLMEVRATLVPVRRRQSPVRSFTKKKPKTEDTNQKRGKKRRGQGKRGEEALKGTLKGMLLSVSVKE